MRRHPPGGNSDEERRKTDGPRLREKFPLSKRFRKPFGAELPGGGGEEKERRGPPPKRYLPDSLFSIYDASHEDVFWRLKTAATFDCLDEFNRYRMLERLAEQSASSSESSEPPSPELVQEILYLQSAFRRCIAVQMCPEVRICLERTPPEHQHEKCEQFLDPEGDCMSTIEEMQASLGGDTHAAVEKYRKFSELGVMDEKLQQQLREPLDKNPSMKKRYDELLDRFCFEERLRFQECLLQRRQKLKQGNKFAPSCRAEAMKAFYCTKSLVCSSTIQQCLDENRQSGFMECLATDSEVVKCMHQFVDNNPKLNPTYYAPRFKPSISAPPLMSPATTARVLASTKATFARNMTLPRGFFVHINIPTQQSSPNTTTTTTIQDDDDDDEEEVADDNDDNTNDE